MPAVLERPKKKAKKKRYVYPSAPRPVFDAEGWAPISGNKPNPYDLHELQDIEGRIRIGWWTGARWDGKEPLKKIVKFKRYYMDEQ